MTENGAATGTEPPPQTVRLHATTIALDGRALAILGPSGSGKSALALDLIALGAELVCDDQTQVEKVGARLVVSPMPAIAGLIEARHVGLLRLPYCQRAELILVLDLGRDETHRLPPGRHIEILGQNVTLLHRPPGGHAASAIFQCLLQRRDTP